MSYYGNAGSYKTSTNFITLFKSTPLDFKKLLVKEIDRCKEEMLIPRVFLDIRGAFTNIHDKNGKEICRSFLKKDIPAYSREVIQIVNNWCRIFQQEGCLNPVIIPFGEFGTSKYHFRLAENYKENRAKAAMLDCGEELNDIAREYINRELQNLDWIFNTKGTNICSIISEDLEFDAAVHLITNNFTHQEFENPYGDNYKRKYFNIILSKDKDFAQCLNEDTVQITKKVKDGYVLVNEINAPSVLMKMKEEHFVPARYMNLALAMIGDASDGYPGIKSCGEVAAGEFLNKFYPVLDKIPAKNNFKKFRSLMKYDFEDKIFLKIKKLYLASKRSFFKSYCLADFQTLCDYDKHKNLMEKHLEKYKRIIFSPEVSEEVLVGKRNFLSDKFKTRYKMLDETSFFHIIVNTEK